MLRLRNTLSRRVLCINSDNNDNNGDQEVIQLFLHMKMKHMRYVDVAHSVIVKSTSSMKIIIDFVIVEEVERGCETKAVSNSTYY